MILSEPYFPARAPSLSSLTRRTASERTAPVMFHVTRVKWLSPASLSWPVAQLSRPSPQRWSPPPVLPLLQLFSCLPRPPVSGCPSHPSPAPWPARQWQACRRQVSAAHRYLSLRAVSSPPSPLAPQLAPQPSPRPAPRPAPPLTSPQLASKLTSLLVPQLASPSPLWTAKLTAGLGLRRRLSAPASLTAASRPAQQIAQQRVRHHSARVGCRPAEVEVGRGPF